MNDRTFIDSNVLVYAHDVDAEEKHEVARQILRDLRSERTGVLSMQVLQEFYVNVTRKIRRPLPKPAGRSVVSTYSIWCVETTPTEIATAFRIEDEHRIGFWYALIVSAASRSGATRVVSEDLKDRRVIRGVRIENPSKSGILGRRSKWDPWLRYSQAIPEVPKAGLAVVVLRLFPTARPIHLFHRVRKVFPESQLMSRPLSRIKLGYYPLPVEETQNIRTLLIPSAAYSAIDPCAGEGTALVEITKNSDASLAAIELDADRAASCSAKGIATVRGSAFECRVTAESCSLLYLNPPYDIELGPHSNQRMELVFLEHCYRWVKTDGVLVFVVPSMALAPCARLLASQFDRITVWRLEHPESVRFHQVVIFGRRKKAHVRGEPKGAELLIHTGTRPNEIAALNQETKERYPLPPSRAVSIHYTGLPLDAIEDALENSLAMQKARGILVPKHQKMSGRPVTPLHKGHVGLLACSGMLNGFFGEGDMRHIAHWRAVKYVDEFNEEGEQEGETIIRKRERFSHELTLAYEDGRVVELRETKEAKVQP